MDKELYQITSEEYYEPQFEHEKIIEDYKKKEFINILQTGKPIVRRSLGNRILELAGFVTGVPYSSFDKCKLKDKKFDSQLKFYLTKLNIRFPDTYYHVKSTIPNCLTMINSEAFLKVLKKFLKEYEVTQFGNITYTIYFDRKHISWGLLDEAVKYTYPKNYIYYKNGATKLDFHYSDINKIHETPHNLFNPYK